MLRGDQGRDGGDFRLAQVLACAHERLQRHPAMCLTVLGHCVGEAQRRALAIREQRAALVAQKRVQRIDRELCLAPEMAAAFDAPAAMTAFGGELRDERAQSPIELDAASARQSRVTSVSIL